MSGALPEGAAQPTKATNGDGVGFVSLFGGGACASSSFNHVFWRLMYLRGRGHLDSPVISALLADLAARDEVLCVVVVFASVGFPRIARAGLT